jgi:lipopolysaccharide/colanic/teichoic acid biosynthesis glycosyltransferase
MLRVIRHYLPLRKALLILSETVILTLLFSLWMTAHLWDPTDPVKRELFQGTPAMNVEDALVRCIYSSFLIAVLSQIALAFNELYDVRVSGSRYDRAGRFVESAGSALFTALLAIVLLHTWGLGRILDFPPLSLSQRVQALIFALLSGFACLYYWRSLFHFVLRRASFGERVLILGTGKAAHELAREILARPDAGYVLRGLLPDSNPDPERAPAGKVRQAWGEFEGLPPRPRLLTNETDGTAALASLAAVGPAEATPETRKLVLEPLPGANIDVIAAPIGTPRTLLELAETEKIDVVVVALEDRRNNLPLDDLLQLRLAGVSVREQEALYEQITGKIAVEALRPSYLIFNEGFSSHYWTELAKRAIDITCALILLIVTWPLMLGTAIAVRLDSAGPILFTQSRVGRDGRIFTLFKFRSMLADAEKQTGPVWAQENDPRITRSGRFIRKTRLDELPQLFNVLAGHMSLVGPRPERDHFVEDLAKKIPYFRQRHIVKPGLTGWAQINYRYGNTFEDAVQKLQYDLFYIKNQSVLFDLSILFNTVKIVLLRKGT